VIEAMACGLPVAYVASGGVPELVGPEAGAGVAADDNWEQPFRPSAEALAGVMQAVAENHHKMAIAARQRAITAFNLENWIARHREIFQSVLAAKA
jgi:glycosyltransferase involved in cell wall biosynthesis